MWSWLTVAFLKLYHYYMTVAVEISIATPVTTCICHFSRFPPTVVFGPVNDIALDHQFTRHQNLL